MFDIRESFRANACWYEEQFIHIFIAEDQAVKN